MITNFFLDNRKGGPHIYSELLNKNFLIKKFINVTNGKTSYKSLEIIVNIIEIYFLFTDSKNFEESIIFLWKKFT